MPVTAPSTMPGYRNPNRQTVIRNTGVRADSRLVQSVYRLRCGDCGQDYGSSGIEIERRRCPHCQGGAPGELLQEGVGQTSLFESLDASESFTPHPASK